MTFPPELTAPDAQLDRLHATAKRYVTGPEGRQVHWAEWGEGAPLVMLHGAYGNWSHFVRNIDAFTADHRVLIPDLPGYGLSDLPAEPSMASVGQGVAAGLTEILGETAPYKVFGFSFGGTVAARLLVDHPGRQSHMMMVAPGGISAPQSPPMRSVRNRTGADLVDAIRFNLTSIMFADPATICPQAMRIQFEGSAQARMRVERLDWGPRLSEIVPGFAGEFSAVWGDSDVFPNPGELPERCDLIRGWCPQADAQLLPGVGHWTQFEAADTVNQMLRRLVDR